MTFSNKVTWEVDPGRCALLIHDMQPHYLGALPESCRRQLVANVRSIAMACIARGIPIFASQVPAQDARERGLMLDMWGRGPTAATDTLDPELGLNGLPVRPLTKRSYSAFYGNDFEVLLRRLGRDQIIIVGVYRGRFRLRAKRHPKRYFSVSARDWSGRPGIDRPSGRTGPRFPLLVWRRPGMREHRKLLR